MRSVRIPAVGAALFATATLSCAHEARAACEALLGAFDEAVAAKSVDAVKSAFNAISSDFVCQDQAGSRVAPFVTAMLALAADDSQPQLAREKAVEAAQAVARTGAPWRVNASIGDFFAGRRAHDRAFEWYERSLSAQRNATADKPTPAEVRTLYAKAGAAKGGTTLGAQAQGRIVSSRDVQSGIFAAPRSVENVAVPLPVQFYTNETRLTPEGVNALGEIAAAVKEQQLSEVRLVGHADPRGDDAYNLELSKNRVLAVKSWLETKGDLRAKITVDWKGSREPFDASVLSFTPTKEEKWALDRRVEWVRSGQR